MVNVIAPTDEQYAAFGKRVAALLGANLEWSSAADYLEEIAHHAVRQLHVPVGDDNERTLRFWRKLADETGVYYDAEEDYPSKEND